MSRMLLILSILALAACQASPPSAEALLAQTSKAVADTARPEADRGLDPMRKPAEVLAFFEIKPGMQVLDVFAGGGYYTEILSHLVGPGGSVTLYNNNPWDNFVNKQVGERLAGNRLPNVTQLTAPPAALATLEDRYDAAIFILGMHDIYYEDPANSWPAIDVPAFLGDIAALVKPGGVLGIIDHNAAAGTDPALVGKSIHRIDPAVIIRDVEAAGFALEASSDLLRNPDDDLTGLVFSEALRWQSDRSVLRFRKL
ncbi:MAG: methyltransferase type 11 [Proteobacteria bacterium]|nr:methyltransferase type 11 [Pseudomonadota bacterium]